MNDDFLHRIRKTPAPEFLARLKTKLDRQPLAPLPRRRWSFTRGLFTGLLLGGAAFALTAVSLTGGRPTSLRSFVSAPVQFLARLMPGGSGSGSGEQPEQDYRSHAVPLGPVWLPAHQAAGESSGQPKVPTSSASFTAKKNPGSESSTAPRSDSATVAGGVVGRPALESLRVVTPDTLYPLVSTVADYTNKVGIGRTQVQLDTGNIFDSLCTANAAVDVVEIPRRITRAEYDRCTSSRPGYTAVVEVKVGYQAIALARAQLYGPLKLSARDLFLALARRVPVFDPNNPETLIDNPNTTWNQINAALPYDKIQVLGPAPDSAPGKLVVDLLLQSGCNSYPWIAALRDSDPDRYEEICGALRTDGAYRTGTTSGWAYTNQLTTNPTAIGILSPGEFRISHDGLVLNPIDGIEPTMTNLAAGTYPAGRAIYLYNSAALPPVNQVFMTFVHYNMYPKDFPGRDPNGWGFVTLDKSESDANLAIAQQRKYLRDSR